MDLWHHRLAVAILVLASILLSLSPLSSPTRVSAQATVFTLNPTSGPAGANVLASGSGFGANETVNLNWNGIAGATLASPTTDGSGSFSNVSITIPSASPGPYNVWAIGQTSGDYTTASFAVTAGAATATPTVTPTLTPTPSGTPAATITPTQVSGATPTPTAPPGPSATVTWRAVNTGTTASLYGVGLNGTGTVIAVGQGSVEVRSNTEGATWQTINASNSGSLDLDSVAFADTTHAWTVGMAGSLYTSSNTGTTWTPISLFDPSGALLLPNLHETAFTSPSVGYLVGGEYLQQSLEQAELFRTSDGGQTWSLLGNVPADEQWDGVAFNQAGVGLAVATNGDIIRTTDGVNWTKVFSQSYPLLQLNAVAFTTDGNTAVAVGDNAVILRSTDQGQTWQQIAVPPTLSSLVNLEGVAFGTGTAGSAVGGTACTGCVGQTAISTADGGATWSITYQVPAVAGQIASPAYLWRIHCDSAVCVAVGDNGTALVTNANPNLRPRAFVPIVFH